MRFQRANRIQRTGGFKQRGQYRRRNNSFQGLSQRNADEAPQRFGNLDGQQRQNRRGGFKSRGGNRGRRDRQNGRSNKTSKSNLDLDMEMATYWGKEAEDEESQRQLKNKIGQEFLNDDLDSYWQKKQEDYSQN